LDCIVVHALSKGSRGYFKRDDVLFIIAVVVGSRAVVAIGLFAIPAFLGPVPDAAPTAAWFESAARWDGAWYREIVANGYTFANDGARHTVVFYPLFPIVVGAFVRAGLPFAIAGMLVANAAFAATAFVLFGWAARRFDRPTARWIVATVALVPMSLFASVAYSESLFMLAVSLVLAALDGGDARVGALAAFGAGLTRGPGILLVVPALVRRRPLLALAALGGVATFAAFCLLRFGDPLAMVHAQAAWRHASGFDAHAWNAIRRAGIGGHEVDHLVLLASVVVAVLAARRFPRIPRAIRVAFWLVAIALVLRWWSTQFENLVLVGLAGCAALACARTLRADLVAYAVAVLCVVFLAGEPLSVDRIAYGSVVLPIALAAFFRRAPFVGTAILTICAYDLGRLAIVFGRGGWAG
jgi:hypothetical protein